MKLDEVDDPRSQEFHATRQIPRRHYFRRGNENFLAGTGREVCAVHCEIIYSQPMEFLAMNLTLDDASMFTSSQQDHIGAVVRFVQVVDRRDSERWRVIWTSEPESERGHHRRMLSTTVVAMKRSDSSWSPHRSYRSIRGDLIA